MTGNLIRLLIAAALLSVAVSAQDPLKVAPKNYKQEFENEWVRVQRVHYGPKEKVPPHFHTERPAAYIYLNASGPVIFKHKDLPYGAITRAPTKPGTVRLYRSVKEVHSVENTGDTPSDFLRVEFKTDPVNENSLRGKYDREVYTPGENYRKVQFENEQIRVTRLAIAAGKSIDISTNPDQPALVVLLTASPLKAGPAGKAGSKFDQGKTRWVAAGNTESVENPGRSHAELLQFDFKTKPVNDPTDRTGSHEHKK
jgi:quercetin dioxygenase-like cupin family protein